jgi:protein-S-isoprenylcysteine O-methyltransferase Ste14
MRRILALLYGFAAYTAGLVALVYAIGFVTALPLPKTIDTPTDTPIGEAIVVDLLLMLLFAIQHSVMARQGFKRWWTQFIPHAIERSTYVLLSGLVLGLLMWQWRSVPHVVWETADPVVSASLVGLSLFGWLIVLSSTFLINHFELFGLQQVMNNLMRRQASDPTFRTPAFYRFVRHPLYLGLIIAFWATPVMTIGHLLFAVVTTAYIFVGIMLEERDLVALFGDEYRRYRDRVGMVLPRLRRLRTNDGREGADRRGGAGHARS